MKHKQLMKDSDCEGEAERETGYWAVDVSWTIYKCKKCGKMFSVAEPSHDWNRYIEGYHHEEGSNRVIIENID